MNILKSSHVLNASSPNSLNTAPNTEAKLTPKSQVLENLRSKLSESVPLRNLDNLRRPEGIATGIRVFDDFFLWKGLPKGELSLLHGRPGTGSTSLWLSAASQVHKSNKWAAWVNSSWELMPSPHLQKKLLLNRLLVVKKPSDMQKLFWILQEMITSSLFEMVGCHLPNNLLKNHQLQKLKKLARVHAVALVFVSHVKNILINPLFSLVIDCHRDFFTVQRALHRPTPFTISGSMIYADLMPELEQTHGGFLC
jgi:recombination protein RecA